MGDQLRTDVSHTMHTYKNLPSITGQPTKQQSPIPSEQTSHPSSTLHISHATLSVSSTHPDAAQPSPQPPPLPSLSPTHRPPPNTSRHDQPTLRSPRLQLHPMPPRNFLSQHLIHQPMLPHHAQPREPARLDLDRVHGPAPARYVLHLHPRPVIPSA